MKAALGTLVLATLLKVIFTVQGVSDPIQTSVFVGLGVFVMFLPEPPKKKRKKGKKNGSNQANRLAR